MSRRRPFSDHGERDSPSRVRRGGPRPGGELAEAASENGADSQREGDGVGVMATRGAGTTFNVLAGTILPVEIGLPRPARWFRLVGAVAPGAQTGIELEEEEEITVHTRQHTLAWLLGLMLTVPGLACTSSQKVPTADRGTLATEACFNLRTVDSFSPLGVQFVYVRTLTGEHYLLTLDRVEVNLPFATGITIADNFSRVCSDTGARITYVNAGMPVFSRVVRVEGVASREVAEQVVKDRTTPESKPKG